MYLLNPNKIRYIVVHTSASYYGDVETVERWHLDRGWTTIGYHWLITNCYGTYSDWRAKLPRLELDGRVWSGRAEKFVGAHVYGYNAESIGVCMIGMDGMFSSAQLRSCAKLCMELQERYPSIEYIMGHYEMNPNKTCPDLDMEYMRKFVFNQGASDEETVTGSIANLNFHDNGTLV